MSVENQGTPTITLREENRLLREALEYAFNVADSIWVDNVTGAADASDPTPMRAQAIMKRCRAALDSGKVA